MIWPARSTRIPATESRSYTVFRGNKHNITMLTSKHKTLLFVLLWLCSLLAQPQSASAQETPPSAALPAVTTDDTGISVTWTNSPLLRTTAAAWQAWPSVSIQGVDIPAQLITVQLTAAQPVDIQLDTLQSRPWVGSTLPYKATELPVQQLPTGEEYPPLVAASATLELPDTPVVLLRQGIMRGQRFGVIAVMPVYTVDGDVREVTDLRFSVKDARPIAENFAAPVDTPWTLSENVSGPSAISQKAALKILVEKSGLQEIPLDSVIATGLAKVDDLARLQLYLKDEPVALEIDSSAGMLRFYASTVGDLWNPGTMYWLTLTDAAGLRMTQRAATTTAGDQLPTYTSAWEVGTSYTPTIYISQIPGPDGDHWFGNDLRTGPGLPTAVITLTAPVGLPPLSASAIMTLTGHAYLAGSHTLDVSTRGAGGNATLNATWSAGNANWAVPLTVAGDTHTLVASLRNDGTANGIRIDRLEWRRPVTLNFQSQGGLFDSGDTAGRYRLSNLPSGFAVYDVTDPGEPIRLNTSSLENNGDLLLDSEAGQQYVVAPASNMRHQPALVSYQPTNWNSALNAQALYISHHEFLSALAPLVLQRKAQGYSVAVVDVQWIYDAWSGGQVSPQAIRAFLRYLASYGSGALSAVTLVGDGTYDPLNYTQRNNVNYIPPYLANVDFWLGETACEPCFAQLNGDNPLDDSLVDLQIARLPVKSAAELEAYLAKLLPYENDIAAAQKRTSILYVTDNFRNPDGTLDGAGDFTAVANDSIALHPSSMSINRIYYDPVTATPAEPWRIADAVSAYQATLDEWQRGPGFVNYIGHAHQWQWAVTDYNVSPPYLMGLYDPDLLTNKDNPSIVLGLTCLTGAFHTPAYSGTTIDERMLLNPNGGAVAVWGSTGFGVGYGHESLQRGFYTRFWESSTEQTVGSLVNGGYFELFSHGICCQESLRTFSLLGDALTVPMVAVGWSRHQLYLPKVTQN